MFKTPVSITEHPKINEWLTLVEKEMRVTLAKLLAESVTEVEIFGKATSIDPNTYITWIDKYQVLSSRRGTVWRWGHWLIDPSCSKEGHTFAAVATWLNRTPGLQSHWLRFSAPHWGRGRPELRVRNALEQLIPVFWPRGWCDICQCLVIPLVWFNVGSLCQTIKIL